MYKRRYQKRRYNRSNFRNRSRFTNRRKSYSKRMRRTKGRIIGYRM